MAAPPTHVGGLTPDEVDRQSLYRVIQLSNPVHETAPFSPFRDPIHQALRANGIQNFTALLQADPQSYGSLEWRAF